MIKISKTQSLRHLSVYSVHRYSPLNVMLYFLNKYHLLRNIIALPKVANIKVSLIFKENISDLNKWFTERVSKPLNLGNIVVKKCFISARGYIFGYQFQTI